MTHTQKTCISINPANGREIGTTPIHSIRDLSEMIISARKAQKEWMMKSFNERKKYLLRLRDYITSNAEEITQVISSDNGKVRVDALATEVLPAAMAINYYAKNAGRFLKSRFIPPGSILTFNKYSRIERVPYGIIGIISPWNYPFGIPMHEIAMALMAGNAVILKTATQTLEVGKIIEKCMQGAELPDGLFHFINLPGSVAGDAFIDSDIDKVFFTGSVSVGKYLMNKASAKLKPISLELGGNDAMIVCRDADLKRAVGGSLWAGFSNSGQSCGGVERIYVDRFIYKEFVALLKAEAAKLRIGEDRDFSTDIGCMTTQSQLDKVKEHVQDAENKGGKIFTVDITGNDKGKGLFHPLVIIENVNTSMVTINEETFGPVIAVDMFDSIDEAIAKTNNSDLGLTASVWSSDIKKANNIASRIEAGTITINDHLMSHGLAETPWGGFKNSSYGRTHGRLGLESMTQPRVVVNDLLHFLPKNIWWYPYSKKVYDGLLGGLNFLYGNNIRSRFEGFFKILPIYLKSFSRKQETGNE